MKKIDLVNVLLGSENTPKYSHGNIFPITALPFGNANWTIETDNNSGNWFYSPTHNYIEGIRLTHQPSPWVGDYGQMLFLPCIGEINNDINARWSSYRPSECVFKPNKIDLYLQRYQTKCKVAPLLRGGIFEIENLSDDISGLGIIPYFESDFELKNNCLTGFTFAQQNGVFNQMKEYFYIEFSVVPTIAKNIENGGIYLTFKEKNYSFNVSTSFISIEQAKINFENDSCKSYQEAIKQAEDVWENMLSKIDVQDSEYSNMFYSCLYRALLYPRTFYENDNNGNAIYYNADLNKVCKGVFYTDNGFWDTYRTVYPLISIIYPEMVNDMIKGFINYYKDTGWLPRWISPGEIGIMPGTLIEAVFADCINKNILDKNLYLDIKEALLKNAYCSSHSKFGRQYLDEFIEQGYISNDNRESINHTIDTAYGDFCIATVCKYLGDKKNSEILFKRSENYKNLFDKEKKFFISKNKNGEFRKKFDPFIWGGDNTEASSWQNCFLSVFDLDGIISLYGGIKAFEKRLDEVFETLPDFKVDGYGCEIHEMSEMACLNLGQCAISNQPSFHIPWLYSYIGKPDKTFSSIKKILSQSFKCNAIGFPGDEDNGTMASWFIFACLGFYPICPGKNNYVVSKPLLNVTLHLPNGKLAKFYESKANINMLSFDDLMNGGDILNR